ncbi:MAG TPA: permease-like cell division protein FtsX [Bacteroidales bacterium]|jgi:cell division transport system permease protein|nr:permease-like cell division protein FtsX [Bacteroidales bacterium]MDD4236461.1 permease-like cell division protein FtsX [Bacteroidales bacterium]MDY0160307.1 permease-like cell division protein FtsX [Bacteroidales bacterium]HXK81562.1 permease-like cell division protein FtsX [Bacteroidales bacterium]
MKTKGNKSAIKSKLRGAYLTSVISISLVLLLLGIVGLLMLNAQVLSNYVKENICFSLFLRDNIKEADIRKFQKTLDTYDFIKSTEYISKEKAAEELKKDLGEDFTEFLGYNPLPESIDIYLIADYANPDSLVNIENRLLGFTDYVKEISYQKNLIHEINENIRNISIFLLIFSALLLLISFALINNTIRLMIYSKRFIIRTMQLVGATRRFIRTPFIKSGLIQGIISAIIAIGILTLIIYSADKQLHDIISLLDYKIVGILFLIVLSLGIIISLISTFFAVNKYLRIKNTNLYY